MAIDNENLEMVQLLIFSGQVETKDALLHAISEEFVEAVELLLEHEENHHVKGTPHVSMLYFMFYRFCGSFIFKLDVINAHSGKL